MLREVKVSQPLEKISQPWVGSVEGHLCLEALQDGPLRHRELLASEAPEAPTSRRLDHCPGLPLLPETDSGTAGQSAQALHLAEWILLLPSLLEPWDLV